MSAFEKKGRPLHHMFINSNLVCCCNDRKMTNCPSFKVDVRKLLLNITVFQLAYFCVFVCVCFFFLHAYIQPTLPHSIYSAERWSAILSAQGYVSLIHRTTITTHLIPGSRVCFKKEHEAGRESNRAGDQEHEKEREREKKESVWEKKQRYMREGPSKSKERLFLTQLNKLRWNLHLYTKSSTGHRGHESLMEQVTH